MPPSSTKVFFKKEFHIVGSLVKSITFSENTSGICQIHCFPFLVIAIIYTVFLYFVATIVAAAFHAQMFFNCSNFLWWLSKWHLSFVASLNSDSASPIEILKQCIPAKQSFPTNDHTEILSLLTQFDFDSVSSHLK